MRKVMRYAVVTLAVILLALWGCHALQLDHAQPADGSSAALGLMLLEQEEGLYVLAVTKNSPADKAGVHPGDYLLRAGEEELVDAAHLDQCLQESENSLTLTLLRADSEIRVTLPTR